MNTNFLLGSILKFNKEEKRNIHTTTHSCIGQSVLSSGKSTQQDGVLLSIRLPGEGEAWA